MRASVFVSVVIACGLIAQCCAYTCEFHSYDDDDDVWNLAPMTRTGSNNDYTYENTFTHERFFVNICAANTQQGCAPWAGACVQTSTSQSNLGDYQDYTFTRYNPNPSQDGVTLIYGSGDVCNGVATVTYTDIACDETIEDGVITMVDQQVECRYGVEMKSKWGCKNAKQQNKLAPQFSVPVIATGFLPSSPSVFGQRTEQSTAQGNLYFDQLNGLSRFNGTVLKPDQSSGNPSGFMLISKQQLKVRMPLSGQCAIDKTRSQFPLLNQAAGHFLGNATYTSLFFNQGETIPVTTWGEQGSNKVLLKLEANTNALVWIDGRLLDAKGDEPRGFFADDYQVEADWKKFTPTLPPSIFSVPSAWNCL